MVLRLRKQEGSCLDSCEVRICREEAGTAGLALVRQKETWSQEDRMECEE